MKHRAIDNLKTVVPGRRPFILCFAIGTWLASFPPARGEDSDRLRYYFNFRAQDTNVLTDVHDAWGGALGLNLNRYVGVELAVDNYELFLEPGGYGGTIGELSIWSVMPQVRLRYPLLRDRLVPYLVAGGGLGFTQFNDPKRPVFGLSVNTDSSTPLGSIGGGLEYFIGDNIALGVEGKYLFGGDVHYEIEGTALETPPNAPLLMASMRFFYPELRPALFAESRDRVPERFYFGLRAGGAVPVNDEVFTGIEAEPEPPAYFDTFNQLFGGVLGLNFGRYLGIEVSAETSEMKLHLPGRGDLGELATHNIIPQLRARYPMMGGRVVPYAVAGVGVSFTELNDTLPAAEGLSIDADGAGMVAVLGGGVEYFVMSNASLSLEARYLFSRGHTLTIDDGPERDGNLDSVLLSFGLRVYMADF
ncbi:hypothetical protein BH20PSE1_BH20PSE1_22220 [soil metagenome]